MPKLPNMNPPNMYPEDSHEAYVTITLLKKGTLSRHELKERIRSIQKEAWARFGYERPYHEVGTYNYWIRVLKRRGLVEEFDDQLRLTALGKWLASSSLDNLFERDKFLQIFICEKCSSLPNHVVLLSPQMSTIDESKPNVRGLIWVELRCPKCSTLSPPQLLRPKAELVRFYNEVVVELGRYVKLEAHRI